MDQELDERKLKILQAIIQTYLDTGEPVGSRTISKYSDLSLSSATIRNEMSDLEDQGYILQPHTSAGRIPSDKGYRLYVDHLMKEKEQEVSDMKDLIIEKADKMDQVLKQVASVLARTTHYATMVSKPRNAVGKIKFIQLSPVDEFQILAVVVLDGNIIKNRLIDIDEDIDTERILKLNMLLNTQLNGLYLEEINLGMIASIKEQAGPNADVINEVLEAIVEAVQEETELEIFTSGTTNIFKYPELSDSEKASELISTFEEKQGLMELISDAFQEEAETGIQVYIGSETPVQTMKDCSVVTAVYELGEGVRGTIGIIGPKRMDYQNVMNHIKTLKKQLDNIFKKE